MMLIGESGKKEEEKKEKSHDDSWLFSI